MVVQQPGINLQREVPEFKPTATRSFAMKLALKNEPKLTCA